MAAATSATSATSAGPWSMCSHEDDPRRSARRLQRFAGRVLRSPDARSRPEASARQTRLDSSARKALFPERESPKTPEGAGPDRRAGEPPRKPRARRRESPPEKRPRTLEETPKAKVALFGSPSLPLSAGAFYGAPSAGAFYTAVVASPPARSRSRLASANTTRRARRREARRGFVGHGVRRPKTKSASRAREAALIEAVQILENSPFNDYIADFFKSAPSGSKKVAFAAKPPPPPPPPPVDEFREEAADYCDERSLVDRLLDEWKPSPPPSPRCLKSIENVARSSPPERTDALASNRSPADASDSENIAVPCDPDELDAQLEKLDREIIKIAKLNNIDPRAFLSPTTEMCSMTSDLFLDSPGIGAVGGGKRRIPEASSAAQRLFPVFRSNGAASERRTFDVLSDKLKIATNKRAFAKTDDQYLIDAGQKKLGPTECEECGVIYQTGNATDEADHSTYHSAGDVLKFAGWKTERFCGRWGEGRTLVVYRNDPAAHWRRICDLLNRVVHPQLGFAAALREDVPYKVYLYVEKKLIVGCLVAERLDRANRTVTHNGVECCSEDSYPVECGVSRLWTHRAYRKRGVATKLMNSMRANFLFGRVLAVEEIAFSSPTPMGRAFAEKYTSDPNFYTYML